MTRPMGPVTAWLAADPERAERVRRVVAEAPPMTAEQIMFARRILFTPTPDEVAAVARPTRKGVARPVRAETP